MGALFTTSPDGSRVAYETCGTGPAVILLHGGGSSRREWHAAGYVARLQGEFTVITMDLRGHGESAAPADPADYAIDKLLQDILAVADACGADHFTLWGMSFGGKVGRYLAARSERVDRCILMGTPLGPGVTGRQRQEAVDFCAHWPPIVAAQRAGALDLDSLSENDRGMLEHLNVPAMLGWVRAMLDWPPVTPVDFRCPTLWLVGSEDPDAMETVRAYANDLLDSPVRLEIVDGLDHNQVFDEIDRVFPMMQAFIRA